MEIANYLTKKHVSDRKLCQKVTRRVAHEAIYHYLCRHKSPDGGIGRRAGLKHQWSNPSRFEPESGYLGYTLQNRLQSVFFCPEITIGPAEFTENAVI